MTVRGFLLGGVLVVGLAGCSNQPLQPILAVPLSSLTMVPTDTTLFVGESATFSVAAVDTGGNPVANPLLTFSSSNPLAVSVSNAGRVNAVGEGTAFVFVESGGQRDSTAVLVLPAVTGWFSQTSGTSNELRAVFFRPDGNSGWAVGTGGRIVATSNAGTNWSTQTSATAFELNGAWFTSDVEGWAVGDGGTILYTNNAGATWVRDTSNTVENLQDVVFTSRDTGFVVGTNGTILRTTDRGGVWTRLTPTPTPVTLRGVSFVTARDGWAVGDGGVILGTHDRGLTWFVVQPAVTVQNLKSVWRTSLSVAHAVGNQGVAPRTVVTPDSAAWELQNAGAANQLEDVFFVSSLTGYAVGFNGSAALVLRTIDGGVSWTPQTANSQFMLNDVFFIDANRGWAVGDNGTILHTVTAGEP